MRCEMVKTPFGWAGVAVSEQGIARVVLPKKSKKAVKKELSIAKCETLSVELSGASASPVLKKAATLLTRKLSGERIPFDLPLDMRYYTAFQSAVWRAAAAIPYGETRSYAWIAKRIGNPRAVRAVGQALGANPVPIIIPCHRVISSSGGLGGYSGGLSMKKKLLDLENKHPLLSRRTQRAPRKIAKG